MSYFSSIQGMGDIPVHKCPPHRTDLNYWLSGGYRDSSQINLSSPSSPPRIADVVE